MDRLRSAINLEIQEGFDYLSLPNYAYFLWHTSGLSMIQAEQQALIDFRFLRQGKVWCHFFSLLF